MIEGHAAGWRDGAHRSDRDRNRARGAVAVPPATPVGEVLGSNRRASDAATTRPGVADGIDAG
jgi:hypothetical protein